MSLIPNINNQSLQLLPDIALWKEQIADAINYKGGVANPNEAFTELAEDIKKIPNFDQWTRLSGVLAGNSYNKNALQGHEENVAAGSITEITDHFGTFTKLNPYCFQFWDLLKKVRLDYITSINTSQIFSYSSIEEYYFENLEECSTIFAAYCPNIRLFYAPNLNRITTAILRGSNVKNLVVGILIEYVDIFSTNQYNLRNVTIGQGTDINLPFYYWTATNVIEEGQSGIDELNSNLYNNLLTKLYDHSQDGQTRTLRIGWLANVSEDNIAYATAKGWTLTT